MAAQNNATKTMSKQGQTKHNKRADVDYVVTEMKLLIT